MNDVTKSAEMPLLTIELTRTIAYMHKLGLQLAHL